MILLVYKDMKTQLLHLMWYKINLLHFLSSATWTWWSTFKPFPMCYQPGVKISTGKNMSDLKPLFFPLACHSHSSFFKKKIIQRLRLSKEETLQIFLYLISSRILLPRIYRWKWASRKNLGEFISVGEGFQELLGHFVKYFSTLCHLILL